MTRHYLVAFKKKMVERLTGKDAISAHQLWTKAAVAQLLPPNASASWSASGSIKKTVDSLYQDEEEDIDGESES